MAASDGRLHQALRLHQNGDLAAAERIYREILERDPDNGEALHLLGVIAHQVGQNETAVALIERAITLQPYAAPFHSNLGKALRALGRYDDAVRSYEVALRLLPNYPEALNGLGTALSDQGNYEEALRSYERALQLKPDYAEVHNNLGTVHQKQGELSLAIACYERCVALEPDCAELHNNLGTAQQVKGDFAAAMVSHRRAIELKPDFSQAYSNLGHALWKLARLEEASLACRRALQLDPDLAAAHTNLANVLQDQGELTNAIACCERALQLDPNSFQTKTNLGILLQRTGRRSKAIEFHKQALRINPNSAEVYNNLGAVLVAEQRPDEAIECYQQALRLKPGYPDAVNNLGNAVLGQGELEEAIELFDRALQLCPDFAEALRNRLMANQYLPTVTPGGLARLHAEWSQVVEGPQPAKGLAQPDFDLSDPDRPLRLGFVSPDFGQHPVGFFLVRFLEAMPEMCGAVVCYSDHAREDDLRKRLETASTIWRDVQHWPDRKLAQQIRDDGIDLLFDLAGHTLSNRLPVFALRPAPIQLTWMGYVGTTGLSTMDYLVADRFHVPSGKEQYYTERILRLPNGYVCYDPPPYSPSVSAASGLKGDFVTFGSFSHPAKINWGVVEVWAKILERVPRSRLVIRYRGFDRPNVQQSFRRRFEECNVDSSRVELLGESSHAELLSEYNRVDVALDTFPYSGGVTTCEAMWMGVPVVTCAGETFAGGHALSHLSNVGVTETIAKSREEYVDIATSLANEPERLAELRLGLRPRMATSPLCDGHRFAEDLMDLLREVWRERCRGVC